MFWFSGIYFTQAFTTGASQNFAPLGGEKGLGRPSQRAQRACPRRKWRIPIDTLTFDFFYPKD